MYLILAFGEIIINALNKYVWERVGYSLTVKLRDAVYNKLIRMPMSFFDNNKNNPGALATYLSTDADRVKGLVSSLYSVMIQNLGGFIFAIIIAFVSSWRMTLIGLGLSPLMVMSAAA